MTQICACEVNGSILGPVLIRHRSVQPLFSKCFTYLVGPNKKICVFRVTTPKKLGRVGRDLIFFFFFFTNECGLFCKQHLSRYDLAHTDVLE